MRVGRKNVFIRSIDESLWNAFKVKAAVKNDRLWGVIAQELEKLLELYLECDDVDRLLNQLKESKQHKTGVDIYTKNQKQIALLKNAILKNYGACGEIPRKTLCNLIRRTLKVTHRQTINDKIKTLIAEGFLSYNDQEDNYVILRGDWFDNTRQISSERKVPL